MKILRGPTAFLIALVFSLVAACDLSYKSHWEECGLHVSYSDGKISTISDLRKPTSNDLRFPEVVDYPVSIYLGRTAAEEWSDPEFAAIVAQFPKDLRGVRLYGEFSEERLRVLRGRIQSFEFFEADDDKAREFLNSDGTHNL